MLKDANKIKGGIIKSGLIVHPLLDRPDKKKQGNLKHG